MSILGVNLVSATAMAVATTTAPLLFTGLLLATNLPPLSSPTMGIAEPLVSLFAQDPPLPDRVLEKIREGTGYNRRPITQTFSETDPKMAPPRTPPLHESPMNIWRKRIIWLVSGTLFGILLTMVFNALRREIAIRDNEKAKLAYQAQDYTQAARLWLKIGFYPDAIRIYEQVIRNQISDSDLFNLYLKAIKMRVLQRDYRTALYYYEAAISLREKRGTSTPRDARDIAKLYSLAADMAFRDKKPELAAQYYRTSAEHYHTGQAPIRESIAERNADRSKAAQQRAFTEALFTAFKDEDIDSTDGDSSGDDDGSGEVN